MQKYINYILFLKKKGFPTSHTAVTTFFPNRLINYVILYLTTVGEGCTHAVSNWPLLAVPATPIKLSLYVKRVSLSLNLQQPSAGNRPGTTRRGRLGVAYASQSADPQIKTPFTPTATMTGIWWSSTFQTKCSSRNKMVILFAATSVRT